MCSGSVAPGQKAEREVPNLENLAWPMANLLNFWG